MFIDPHSIGSALASSEYNKLENIETAKPAMGGGGFKMKTPTMIIAASTLLLSISGLSDAKRLTRGLLPTVARTRVVTKRTLQTHQMGRQRLLRGARRNSDMRSVVQATFKEVGPKKIVPALKKMAVKGKIGWTDYLDALDLLGAGGGIFDTANLNKPGASANFTFFGKDKGARPKFVSFRDYFSRQVIEQGVRVDQDGEPLLTPAQEANPALVDHSISVATPNGPQPVWLHKVDPKGAGHLGRMVRDALGLLPKVNGSKVKADTLAYVNMPGVVTMPRLHAHGVWRSSQTPKVQDWDGFVTQNRYQNLRSGNDYQIFAKPANGQGLASRIPVVAVANKKHGSTAKMGSATDSLVGQMILDVYKTALKHAPTGAWANGRIEIDSTDGQIAVRLYQRPKAEE